MTSVVSLGRLQKNGFGSVEVKIHLFFQLLNGLQCPEMHRKIFPFVRGGVDEGGSRGSEEKICENILYFKFFKGKFFFHL